ncbi:MAG: pyridoxal-phosphate-dependent aminotransferase family protein [Rhizobiaceae bacterium]
MTFSTGRTYLAIPGPSVVPDAVLSAMHRGSPDIYAGELPDMMPGVLHDLRAVARTAHHVAIYIANGHGAWEAVNTNLFSPGDKALVLVTGRFGEGWAQSIERLGVKVDRLDFGRHDPVDPGRVAEALRADTGHGIRAVVMTHVDTSSSVRNDVRAVRAALNDAGHPALLVVDCIASIGCERFEMDDWGVDVAVGASQKGLMVPPGLGFVWLNSKAKQVGAKARLRTPYWDWTERAEAAEFYQLFGGTAPTHSLFGLRTALGMILREEGLENVWARHRQLARAMWAAFDAWGDIKGAPRGIDLNIADPAFRSHAVTTARFDPPMATALRAWMAQNAGVTLGLGIGMAEKGTPAADAFLRVAHMGHVNAHMTLGVLGAMEAGMKALGIRHGEGALSAAAGVFAQL